MFSLCEVCDQWSKISTFTTETYPDVTSTYSLKDKKGLSGKATSTLCYEEHQGNMDRKHKRGSVPSVQTCVSTKDWNKNNV